MSSRAASVQPSPVADTRDAASRSLRLPPAGRFWKENGGVKGSRTALPKTAAAAASGPTLSVSAPVAGAASSLLPSSAASSPSGPPAVQAADELLLSSASIPSGPPATEAAKDLPLPSASIPSGPPASQAADQEFVLERHLSQAPMPMAHQTLLLPPSPVAPAVQRRAVVAADDTLVPVSLSVRPSCGDLRGCLGRDEEHVATGCCGSASCEDSLGDWHLVTARRRSPPRTAFRRPAFKARAPPAWLRNRCFRCLSRGHRASSCREPVRCMNCLHSGHIARFCRAKSSFGQTSPVAPPPNSPPSLVKEASSTEVLLQSVLAEQAELLRAELQGCLARVGSFLARAEATLGKQPVVVPDISSLTKLHGDSTDDGEANIYACFSPCAVAVGSMSKAIVRVVAPVMQILPELREVSGEPTSSMSAVQPKVDSLVTSASPLEPSQSLSSVETGRSDAVIIHLPESAEQVVSEGDEFVAVGALSPGSGALSVEKLCDFLASMEAASLGSGKTIGSLLKTKATKGKSKKVGSGILKRRSFQSKSKRSGPIGKMSAVG